MKLGCYTLLCENFMRKLEYLDILNINEYGWGNGYVLLPHKHPYYGKHYDDLNIDINIHGGVSFSDKFDSSSFLEHIKDRDFLGGDLNRENIHNFDDYWMIGFDTNHYTDDIESCSKEYVLSETESLLDQCVSNDIEGMKKYKLIYNRDTRKQKLDKIRTCIGQAFDT